MSTATGHVKRRTLLRMTSASAAAAATGVLGSPAVAAPSVATARPASVLDGLLDELDQKIVAGMARYGIPGVAVGVFWRGAEYVKGYGVTNVDDPVPVDGDTVFRIGSTTKTFTATTVMRLVEQGKLALDAPVRRYLPDFRTSDPSVAPRVTVRQLLNHTPGWLGDYLQDFGGGDDALTRYVAGLAGMPQLTPPGQVFAYNNAAFMVAGRLIEVVTGKPYETAVRELLIDPLGLTHSRYSLDELTGVSAAASHAVVDGSPVVEPAFYYLPRSINPAGGVISSVRDQLRYARFHLGDGTVPGGPGRVLSERSLHAMRSRPGPGGTLYVELDGFGVSWMLRPSAEDVRIVQHGGDWTGQHSGFLMVPDRGFALTLLTNSIGGPALVAELFIDEWALHRFAGVHNLPAVPRALTSRQLAPYVGRYSQQGTGLDGELVTQELELAPADGQLAVLAGGFPLARLAFYRRDYVLVLDPDGTPAGFRANFLRDPDGSVAWLRYGGRLNRHEATSPAVVRATRSPQHFLTPWVTATYT